MTWLPTPIFFPAKTMQPMETFAMSPTIGPSFTRLVSTFFPSTSILTEPYVFFRLLKVLPAPRLTHSPTIESPMYPWCDLFVYDIMMEFSTSPPILHSSPIDVPLLMSAACSLALGPM